MTTVAPPVPRRLGATMRHDRWWLYPLAAFTFLSILGVYAIVVAAMNKDFLYLKDGSKLLSPLYSPDLSALLGWHNGKFPFAFLVLWAPLGLRSSCYYYRKTYYRSYFLSPPACAVGGAGAGKQTTLRKYTGETKLPLVLNNLHRFFFYLTIVVIAFLTYDMARAFIYKTSTGTHFGISVGAIIMLLDLIALCAFTFGCNSWRHLVGGGSNCFSCSVAGRCRHQAWKQVSWLNAWHSKWAWISLFSVMFTDFYIRLVAGGIFIDPHHIF